MIIVLGAGGNVDEPVRPQLEADIAACLDIAPIGIAAIAVALAAVHRQRAAMVVILQHDVDDAGDRVRSILGGGTIAQHLDPLDGGRRDQIDIDRIGTLVDTAGRQVEQRAIVAPFAVHQHQHMRPAQTAQARRARNAVPGRGTDGQRVETRQQHAQCVAQRTIGAQCRQLAFVDHVDRHRAFQRGGGPATVADDDDRPLGIGWGRSWGRDRLFLRKCR